MTEEQLLELWGDGSEFGLSPNDELFMNNAFREVAMKFAQRVADIEYERGFDDGWESRADAEYFNFDYLKLQQNHND